MEEIECEKDFSEDIIHWRRFQPIKTVYGGCLGKQIDYRRQRREMKINKEMYLALKEIEYERDFHEDRGHWRRFQPIEMICRRRTGQKID